MHVKDLICSKDGSISLTKLSATTAHFLFAVAFITASCKHGFDQALWLTYGSFAIGHAAYDKSTQMLKAYKEGVNGKADNK